MMESDERTAGAVILGDLALFNKAAVYVETEIDPLIRTEFSATILRWINDHGWTGETDASEDFSYVWLAPPQWHADTEEFYAKFHFGLRAGSEGSSYDIANLFGVGEDCFGFRFKPEHGSFGGGRAWNAYAKTLADHGQKLGALDWVHEGKGVFFRPVIFPADRLVSAWNTEDWSEALAPLGKTLADIEAALLIFDGIINGAKANGE